MVKLMIILPSLSIGGAQRFCLNLLKVLRTYDIHTHVVSLRIMNYEEDSLEQEFINKDILLTKMNYKKVFLAIPELIMLIRKYKPDIVMSTVNNVDFWVSVSMLFVNDCHLIIRKANVIFNTTMFDAILLKCKLPYRIADKVVVLTQQMKEVYLRFGVSPNKLVVINNMVDTKDLRIIKASEKHSLRKTKKINIVTVSRMVPEKRHDILVHAFEIIVKKYNNCVLTIVGSGPEETRIRKLISEDIRNKVFISGFQSNPYEYMGNGDIFCLTSDFEGFPNVIIEAFACGLPVVATNGSNGASEIINDGVNGFLAEKDNYESVAHYISLLIEDEDLRREMSKNAVKASMEYSPNLISKEYVELFNSVIGAKSLNDNN